MVKEFEHQNEQDLAILIDPWLPRARATAEQRETIENAISFAATLCVETARHQGRRIILGWTGADSRRAARASLGQAPARASRTTRRHDAGERWRPERVI